MLGVPDAPHLPPLWVGDGLSWGSMGRSLAAAMLITFLCLCRLCSLFGVMSVQGFPSFSLDRVSVVNGLSLSDSLRYKCFLRHMCCKYFPSLCFDD